MLEVIQKASLVEIVQILSLKKFSSKDAMQEDMLLYYMVTNGCTNRDCLPRQGAM